MSAGKFVSLIACVAVALVAAPVSVGDAADDDAIVAQRNSIPMPKEKRCV